MNSLIVVCLGLYSVGAGVARPEDKKKAPMVEPAKKDGAGAGPMVPAGPPNLKPGDGPGAGKGAGFPIPFNGPNAGAMPLMPKMPQMPKMMLPAGIRLVAPMGGGPMPVPQVGFQGPFPGPQERELPKDLVPTLLESLKDKDQDVRKYVAGALVRVGKEAVEPLTEILKGKDKAQRANAAYILGRIGAEAREAMPLLIKAMKDDDREVRLRAAFALERLLAAPRHNMMGMGGMPMPFNPMTGMMGAPEQKPAAGLPDPGPVAPLAEAVKPVKEPEKTPAKKADK
jgi:hypothetical protein